jgi:hypothetical protein
VVVKRT